MRKAMFLNIILALMVVLIGGKVAEDDIRNVKSYVINSVEDLNYIAEYYSVDFMYDVDCSQYTEEYFENKSFAIVVFEHISEFGIYDVNSYVIHEEHLEVDVYVDNPYRKEMTIDHKYVFIEFDFVAGEDYFVKLA